MKKLIAAFLVLTLAVAACKKSDDKKGGSDALTTGKWQITALTLTLPFGGPTNLLDTLSACQQDNFYMFNANTTITLDEGATKCNATDSQTVTDGNWALLSSNSKLQLSGSSITQGYGDNITLDVKELSSTTLKLQKDTMLLGFNAKLEATLTNMK